ncbi:MAG: MoaD/ThiS family protein [Planctomycetota bacterium]
MLEADGGVKMEVRLFAGAREAIGRECITIEVGEICTARVVKETIARMYPEIAPLVRASRIAAGNAFVADDDRLESAIETGKTIALIPPVSGG